MIYFQKDTDTELSVIQPLELDWISRNFEKHSIKRSNIALMKNDTLPLLGQWSSLTFLCTYIHKFFLSKLKKYWKKTSQLELTTFSPIFV